MKQLPVNLTRIARAVMLTSALGPLAMAGYAQPDPSATLRLRMDHMLTPAAHAEPERPGLDQADLFMPGSISCRALTPQVLNRLTLLATVEHVLCKNPALNQALMLVDEQQAGVDLARSAFRPRVSASAEFSTNGIPSNNSGAGFLGSSLTGSLGLSWVLYDSGVRNATVGLTRQLLNSARAGQQTATLNAVNDALRLYVEAATAWARLDALRETETVARLSLEAAQAKHESQVASLAEKLQAMTALAQATLDRVRAEGVWETARGLLALAMGFAAKEPLELAPINAAFPGASARRAMSERVDSAKLDNPRLRGGRADVLALKSRLDSIRAEDKGSVSLSMGTGSSRDLSTPGSGFERSVSGYVIARVPIFNGAEQQAREGQVLAQIASREAALSQIERDVESELWRNARQLETEAQNFEAAKLLLYAATQSYQITFGRYKAGVGSILELIGTQAALSTARAQLTQAQLAHVQARLRLEVASGHLLLPN